MPIDLAENDIPKARIDLIVSRTGFVLFCGAVIYPFFFILDWHERPWDRTAALIVRGIATLVILVLVRLTRTAWGQPKALLLGSIGFLVGYAGFAVIIWHAKGFGTSNGDAFELFFGPYCVLIPTTTAWAALMGISMMCIQLWTYAHSGTPVNYNDIAWNAIPFFIVFLTGRHVANVVELAWRREFLERAALEEAIKLGVIQDKLAQSERMAALGRVAAGFAHELKNPLFVIGSSASILERAMHPLIVDKEEGNYESKRKDDLLYTIERLRAAAENAASVCDLLRQFSSPTKPDPVPADLNALLDSAVSLLEVKADLKDPVIHRHYGELVLVPCDSKSVIQVFVNLIDNALDAIPTKGNIWLSTYMLENRVTVVIKDDGQGVSSENLPRLFEPFFSTKKPGTGTGLGLALSRSVMEKHGGSVRASNSKQGFTVTVTFPASGY